MKKNITIYIKEEEYDLKYTKEQQEIDQEYNKAMMFLCNHLKHSSAISRVIRDLITWQDQIINQIYGDF